MAVVIGGKSLAWKSDEPNLVINGQMSLDAMKVEEPPAVPIREQLPSVDVEMESPKAVSVELFSGTASFSKVAERNGMSIFTIDLDPSFKPSLLKNMINVNASDLPKNIDVLWASPPCDTFSVQSIGHHWKGGVPSTEKCLMGIKLLEHTIELIAQTKPKIWFIENPMGKMRTIIGPIFEKHGIVPIHHLVTYCQYGDKRMKSTDIWTNSQMWISKPPCKNGDSCHEKAPRGSRTGTQGLPNKAERGRIPEPLMVEVVESCLKELMSCDATNASISAKTIPELGADSTGMISKNQVASGPVERAHRSLDENLGIDCCGVPVSISNVQNMFSESDMYGGQCPSCKTLYVIEAYDFHSMDWSMVLSWYSNGIIDRKTLAMHTDFNPDDVEDDE